ncbi:transferase [Penicillium canariense]|uniref:Transferase n=1 Tax=Penicillium canariense TaxID=189055 RepID=A0A9W9I7E2_9EURO|nr:transferase [Penicillium canariense]KAJ5168049.1 transferase [Penicillium canariense]
MNASSSGSTVPPSQDDKKFLIRRMQYSDIPFMANIATTEYFESDLNKFLCPHRRQYPDHLRRRFVQMMRARYLDPRSMGFVAVEPSSPRQPVGYAQFTRLGNDEAAQRLITVQSSVWLALCGWWLRIQTSIETFLWPDRSIDRDAMRQFDTFAKRDAQTYWESTEMKATYQNRWHVRSLVVSSSHQRQGIGRALMAEVLQRAQHEEVVVGLEASGDGEKLYRALGFRMRGPFSLVIGPPVGGIMMWTPEKTDDVMKYELSDADKGGYLKSVTAAIFYELPLGIDQERLISSMTEGLKNATRQLPFMAGYLHFDDSGKLCITKSPANQLEFDIHRFESTEHKSLPTLAATSFSPDTVDLTHFLPESPEDEKPVCRLKLSLVQGGLVLGFNVNHAAGDWTSIEKFLSLVCQSSKAHQERRKMPTYMPDLNRAPYNTPAIDSTSSRQDLLEALPLFYVMEKSQFKPPPSQPSQSSIYKISKATVQQIKAQCSPYLSGVDFISSYDCISALIWVSITRARLHLHPEKATSTSRFIHPIDVRARDPESKTSERYFGNAVIGSQAGPLDAQALVADGDRGLATAASLIRQSSNSVSLSSIGYMTALISSLSPTETLGTRADVTGMDVFMNTWYSESTEKYDIGAGTTPVAFRLHSSTPGACAVILPAFSRGLTRAFEVHLQLAVEEHELLRGDAEFLKYFDPVA